MNKQAMLEEAYQNGFDDELQKAAGVLSERRKSKGGRITEQIVGTAGALGGLLALLKGAQTGVGKKYIAGLQKMRGKGVLGAAGVGAGSILPYLIATRVGAAAPLVAGRLMFPPKD